MRLLTLAEKGNNRREGEGRFKMSCDGNGWSCSLGTLGLCIDSWGDPIKGLATSLDVCPYCSLPQQLNARNTHGLLHDINPLIPFLNPFLDHITPVANMVAEYLRIVSWQIGDCVDAPDSEGYVHGAVVLQTLTCQPTATVRERRRPWFPSSSLTNKDSELQLVLIRFLGWQSPWDEILEADTLRTYSYPPSYVPKQIFSEFSTLRENARSWLEDDRWVGPMVYVYWKRYEHGNFIAEVLAGRGFSHTARKE